MLREPIIDVSHRVFCGPRAIAVLTGVPVSRIEKMFRRIRSEWARRTSRDHTIRPLLVRGVYNGEAIKVLARLGCTVTPLQTLEPTIGRFIEDTRTLGLPCLVNVTHHYAVTFKGECSDMTAARPAKRVIKAWTVQAPAVPRYTTGAPITAKVSKPAPDIRSERAARIQMRIVQWERKAKRAATALRKLRRQAAYYERALSQTSMAVKPSQDN